MKQAKKALSNPRNLLIAAGLALLVVVVLLGTTRLIDNQNTNNSPSISIVVPGELETSRDPNSVRLGTLTISIDNPTEHALENVQIWLEGAPGTTSSDSAQFNFELTKENLPTAIYDVEDVGPGEKKDAVVNVYSTNPNEYNVKVIVKAVSNGQDIELLSDQVSLKFVSSEQ